MPPVTTSPPSPLDLLRAQSGLSIDAEGRFLHRGEPITHQRTLEVLWGSLAQGPDGRWQASIGRETGDVAVEETPWTVRGVRFDGAPPRAATLLLAGGGEGALDPASLRLAEDGVLRCRLLDGRSVRFARAGQLALGAALEEAPLGSGRFTLALDGRAWPVQG